MAVPVMGNMSFSGNYDTGPQLKFWISYTDNTDIENFKVPCIKYINKGVVSNYSLLPRSIQKASGIDVLTFEMIKPQGNNPIFSINFYEGIMLIYNPYDNTDNWYCEVIPNGLRRYAGRDITNDMFYTLKKYAPWHIERG